MRRATLWLGLTITAMGAGLALAPGAVGATPPSFSNVKIMPAPGGGLPWTEPRIATDHNGTIWTVTNDDKTGQAVVLFSTNGGRSFTQAAAPPPGQTSATPDTDIITYPPNRVLASELDDAGINFPTGFTDDGGKTWTQSQGSNQLADQDRQWFAAGPDPVTHKTDVYLLFHNLASGNVQHNMFVAKSTDGGATFGVPVPTTLPGSDAYTDLQCADSGGPSTIFVNQQNGTVYALFTTRASPTPAGDLGGCAPLLSGQPLEFNIVAGTRVWLAQSTDGGQTWTNSLAVDDASTGQIVSMQLAQAALDTAGNVYVVYPESPLGTQYPDYSGAGVKYKWAPPAADGKLKWSDARTIVPAQKGAPGHLLVHTAIGDPGQLEAFYWTGSPPADKPVWHMETSQVLDALSPTPHVTEARMSDVPTDTGTASEEMGACTNEGPVTGIVNGLACGRSPDVWGTTLSADCRPSVVWPAVDQKSLPGNDPGTWVSTLSAGQTLCGSHPGVSPRLPASAAKPKAGSCPDRIPPVSKFTKRGTRHTRRGLRFRGTSKDKGCTSANAVQQAGFVSRVDISIAKVRGKGTGANCSFLTAKGKLTSYRNCRRPVLLKVRGTSRWSFAKSVRLPAGHYRVVVRGVDRAHNKESPHKGRNIAYFTLR